MGGWEEVEIFQWKNKFKKELKDTRKTLQDLKIENKQLKKTQTGNSGNEKE